METALTKIIDVREARRHLSKLVDEAAAGRDIIIAKAGKPMAKLVPLEAVARPKKLGLLKGRIKVPHDFDAPLALGEILPKCGQHAPHLKVFTIAAAFGSARPACRVVRP
jgi:prevent-host-death family protein